MINFLETRFELKDNGYIFYTVSSPALIFIPLNIYRNMEIMLQSFR